jgi:hypothetical protein
VSAIGHWREHHQSTSGTTPSQRLEQRQPANIPGLEVVAQRKAVLGKHEGPYAATIYPGPKEKFVFNAATIWWSDGLSAPPGYQHPAAHGAKPRGPDARAQRITANQLNRFRGGKR